MLWHERFRSAVLVVFLGTFLFVWGTTYMQGFVNYPYWRDVGAHLSNDAFIALREAHYWKIDPLAVYPGMVALLCNGLLLVLPHPAVSRLLVGLVFASSLVVAVATFAVLIPIQDQLDAIGYDRELIEQLIRQDFWFRKVPGTIGGLLVLGLLWQLAAVRR